MLFKQRKQRFFFQYCCLLLIVNMHFNVVKILLNSINLNYLNIYYYYEKL